jgi:uncharacterized protein
VNKIIIVFLGVLLFSCNSASDQETEGDPPLQETDKSNSEIKWLPFSKDAFLQAAQENKLVFLEIGANWCHWCHVMDEKTYSDSEVQSYLAENFILCREDQDSRPDLYAAYRKWGWPAIIAFDKDKNVVMRLKGYQEKNKFLKILKKTVRNPEIILEDEPQATELNDSEQALFNKFLARLDHEKGMYQWNHKYLPLPGIEHGLRYYEHDSLKKWTDLTVKNSFSLVDPVWSGAYQYSAKKSWNNQHYEKLLRIQAAYITTYAKYGQFTKNEAAISTAENIYGYCLRFLHQDPLFYNSQNADVIVGKDSKSYYESDEEERLSIGTPSVDKHVYTKENALLGQSLIYLWAATGKEKYLNKSVEMLEYINENIRRFKGVYKRELRGESLMLSFEDNLQMLNWIILSYQATGEKTLLKDAKNLGMYLIREFDREAGMVASVSNSPLPSTIVLNTNLEAVITYNFLSCVSGDKVFFDHAEYLFQKLDKQELVKTVGYIPSLIRAKKELQSEPYHAVFITDGTNESLAKSFYKRILGSANPYIVFERVVIGEFTEDQEILYGGMPSGTLFMCTSTYCSAPITTTEGLQEFLDSN